MTVRDQLRHDLAELQNLALFQRALRLGLRAIWLGIAGVLFGWSVQALWGLLPSPWTWVLLGTVFGLLPVVGFLATLHSRSKWVWRLDRRLGLEEQVSTAWEAAQRNHSGHMSEALISDVLSTMPHVRSRMLRYGWFLERDFVALVIVLLLAGMVLASTLVQSYADLIGPPPEVQVPAVEEFQTLQEPPASADPAQPEQETESQTEGGPSAPESQPGDSSQPGGSEQPAPGVNPGALADALRGLGSDLSQQAPTYDLGQALEQLDLNDAAGALDHLNDQLDGLSPEAREKMAESLENAAGEVEAAGDDPLADDMRGAAESLEGQDPSAGDSSTPGSEALDQLAQDLRDRAQDMQAFESGGGAGNAPSGQTGLPEPADRLQGEGGEMELPLDDSSQSGLLSPAPPDASGNGTASGSLDSATTPDQDVIQSPLVPNAYLWKWRDVVSSYFER